MADVPRGGTALSAILPGLPQLLEGRWGVGGSLLVPWLGAVALVVARARAVADALGSGTAAGRSAVVVLAAAGLAWGWSLHDRSRDDPRDDEGVTARLFRDPWASAGVVVLAVFAWLAVAAPLLAPEGGNRVFGFQGNLAPSALHPMGTDVLGTDVLHRFLEGARATLGVGFGAGLGGALLGVAVGAVAGFAGGWPDRIAMRTADFFIAFPKLVLLIALVAVLEPSPFVLGLFIALTQWPALARVVRGEMVGLQRREFVAALGALGFSRRRILLLHLLPNAQGTILVGTALSVANALLIEAGLGFLGIGLGGDAYRASWGLLIRDGAALFPQWWVGGFAGLALVLVVVALNFVADALRDVLDPRSDLPV